MCPWPFYVVKITFCRAGNGMPLCGGGHMPSQCDTPFQVDRAVRSRQPRPRPLSSPTVLSTTDQVNEWASLYLHYRCHQLHPQRVAMVTRGRLESTLCAKCVFGLPLSNSSQHLHGSRYKCHSAPAENNVFY